MLNDNISENSYNFNICFLITISIFLDIVYWRLYRQIGHTGVQDRAGLLDRVHQRRVRRPQDPEQVHPGAEGEDQPGQGDLQVAGS